MKKKDAIEKIAEKMEISKKDAENTLATVLNTIVEGVVDDKEFNISGWGKFFAKEQEARTAMNPSTGETINVPSKQVIKFKVGSKLKKAINENQKLEL